MIKPIRTAETTTTYSTAKPRCTHKQCACGQWFKKSRADYTVQCPTCRRTEREAKEARREKLRERALDEALYGPELDELELAKEYWG